MTLAEYYDYSHPPQLSLVTRRVRALMTVASHQIGSNWVLRPKHEGNIMSLPIRSQILVIRSSLALLLTALCFACSCTALSQIPFTGTYQLGGNIEALLLYQWDVLGIYPGYPGSVPFWNRSKNVDCRVGHRQYSVSRPKRRGRHYWEVFVGPPSAGFPLVKYMA